MKKKNFFFKTKKEKTEIQNEYALLLFFFFSNLDNGTVEQLKRNRESGVKDFRNVELKITETNGK